MPWNRWAAVRRWRVWRRELMNNREFIRRARRYARRNGLEFYFDAAKGKGSHGTVYVGDRETQVPHGEIATGTFMSMLRDLNINRREF